MHSLQTMEDSKMIKLDEWAKSIVCCVLSWVWKSLTKFTNMWKLENVKIRQQLTIKIFKMILVFSFHWNVIFPFMICETWKSDENEKVWKMKIVKKVFLDIWKMQINIFISYFLFLSGSDQFWLQLVEISNSFQQNNWRESRAQQSLQFKGWNFFCKLIFKQTTRKSKNSKWGSC